MLYMLKQALLIETIVAELAKSAPDDWDAFVFYTEFLRDPELGVRNVMTDRCWIGEQQTPFDTSHGPAIEHNGGSIKALRELFALAESEKQTWCGFGLLVHHSGQFKSTFYYEGTPMLDSNRDGREERVEEITRLFG